MSDYRIPRDPSWCVRCIRNAAPCDDHRGPDGKPQPYAGPDAYEPSSWVLEVVGGRYRGWDGVYICTGYDPRCGFWMERADGQRRTNVSERAIGGTFHRVRMTAGARVLLGMYASLGRAPSAEEAEGRVLLDLATRTLRDLGCVDDGGLTDAGRLAFVEDA